MSGKMKIFISLSLFLTSLAFLLHFNSFGNGDGRSCKILVNAQSICKSLKMGKKKKSNNFSVLNFLFFYSGSSLSSPTFFSLFRRVF